MSEAFASFGAFAKLYELISAFLKSENESNRRLFQDHVQPIYELVEVINEDYMKTIAAFQDKLAQNNEEELMAGFNLVRSQQAAMRTFKDKLSAFLEAYCGTNVLTFPPAAKEFFQQCSNYFNIDHASPNVSQIIVKDYSSWYSHILGDDFAAQSEIRDYENFIAASKADISKRWKEIAGAYAKARIELLQ